MSFKNLNDIHRRRALVPFLEATEFLEGHIVAVAVTKRLSRMSTGTQTMDLWKRLHGLQAKWDPKAFEQMIRIAHFFSMFLAAWSSSGMHVSWLTDDDSIVANPGRLDDAHQLAARLSGLYVPHQLGEFMMNTVSVDTQNRAFEDFVAILDLAAGMVAEVLSGAPVDGAFGGPGSGSQPELSDKSEIIADWFGHSTGRLKKSCILIDRASEGKFGIGELRMGR